MSFYPQSRGRAFLFSTLSLAVVSTSSVADMSTTPVIGGV